MGSFRFRRTVKIAPGVRLNINKKSVGLSAGVPGARISKNTDGRRTRSIGVPGTGLYWREQTGPHGGSSAAPQQHAAAADGKRQEADPIQAYMETIASVSIDVPKLDGGNLALSFTVTPETYAYMNEQVDQRVVWEGGSPADHQLAGDPKYADWTVEQVVRATVDQSVRLMQQVRREMIIDAVTSNADIVAEIGEAEASRAAERLADAIDTATSSS
jgi:hypothetical protein